MTQHKTHDGHTHTHGSGCGHKTIEHEGHRDYLHDGHMHHIHDEHIDDHNVAINKNNPKSCTPEHKCVEHDKGHVHGSGCGHETIPHGNHVDYVVGKHLHHPHGNHCDDHGTVDVK